MVRCTRREFSRCLESKWREGEGRGAGAQTSLRQVWVTIYVGVDNSAPIIHFLASIHYHSFLLQNSYYLRIFQTVIISPLTKTVFYFIISAAMLPRYLLSLLWFPASIHYCSLIFQISYIYLRVFFKGLSCLLSLTVFHLLNAFMWSSWYCSRFVTSCCSFVSVLVAVFLLTRGEAAGENDARV